MDLSNAKYLNNHLEQDEYWKSLRTVFIYLHKDFESTEDGVAILDEDIPNKVNTLAICFYKCMDCSSFHFPDPCGISKPGIINENNINNYKCESCYQNCKVNGLVVFDDIREKLRKIELDKLTELDTEEKCPICLDYLIVCENVVNKDGKKERNVFLLCGHKMCRKCYYSKIKNLSVSNRKCPICRENC